MDKVDLIFLQILRAALQGKQLMEFEAVTETEWAKIFQLAEIHNVLPLVYQVVYNVSAVKEMEGLRRRVRQLVMLQAMKTEEFLQMNRALLTVGVKPLVVKGFICRSLYPTPDFRLSSDEDILIPEEQYDTCHVCLLDLGMYTTTEESQRKKDFEVPYYKREGVLYLELHKSLFPPEADAYGDWNRFFTKAEKYSIEIDGVHSLNHTDHLFYLLCHAFKHFLHSGFGVRQVCDIIMYANTYGDYVDWDMVYQNCCEIHAEVFAAALFKIGQKYLVFDPEKAKYPQSWQQITVDETNMLRDLLGSGVFGGSTMSRKHSSNMTLDAVTADKQGKKAKMSLKNTLFPSFKSMEKRYPYLKKYPCLLPAAWADRILKYGKEKKQSANNSAVESLKIGSQRIDLLREYKVIK